MLIFFLVTHTLLATVMATTLLLSDSKFMRATLGFFLALNITQVIDIVEKIS